MHLAGRSNILSQPHRHMSQLSTMKQNDLTLWLYLITALVLIFVFIRHFYVPIVGLGAYLCFNLMDDLMLEVHPFIRF
jgi:hypothetical protein